MTLNCSGKNKEIGDKQELQDDIDNKSPGLKNDRCYSILGNVNVYTQGMHYEMGGTVLSKTVKEKDLGGYNEC